MNKLKDEYLTIKHILRYDLNPDDYTELKEYRNKYYNSLNIIVCEILSAERIPKTDKLLKFKINTGIDVRECVTNLGYKYKPNDFIGNKIAFITNLEEVIIMGISSNAMIFIPDTNIDIFNICNNYEIGNKILNI